jgi:purine-binding chemotaxis protein CheW
MNTSTLSNDIIENEGNLYLYFKLGNNKYALNVNQIIEIIQLPLLDYPQKLSNNIIGLLNYNNLTINILDLRFYLKLKVTPYSINNQILIIKTEENIFGLIIDAVENIISLDSSKIKYFPFSEENKIIEFIYKKENENICIINLITLENILKQGVPQTEIDVLSLFPADDDSKYKLKQRHNELIKKFDNAPVTFSQDKFISFKINENIYCINIEYVKEFLKNPTITPIPCNVDYIPGVIALRGDFITIVDLEKILGMSIYPKQDSKNKISENIIILELSDYKIGFMVEKIFNIINISDESIKKNLYDKQNAYIYGEVLLDKKLYIILNIKNILSDEKFFIEDNT